MMLVAGLSLTASAQRGDQDKNRPPKNPPKIEPGDKQRPPKERPPEGDKDRDNRGKKPNLVFVENGNEIEIEFV